MTNNEQVVNMLKRTVTMRLFAAVMMLASLMFYVALNLRADAQTTQPKKSQTKSSPVRSRRSTATAPSPQQTPAPRTMPTLQLPSSGGQNTAVVPPDDNEEVVRVSTNLTTLLFTAVDQSQRFITTLRREDVRVIEDNVPQPVSTFERETDLPLSLGILIDVSRSQERTLPEEKNAASAFIRAVIRPEKDRTFIVSFAGVPTLMQGLTSDAAALRKAIDGVNINLPPDNPECEKNVGDVPAELDARCGTSIWDSIWSASDQVLSRTPERTRRAIILLTDGDDTTSELKRQEAVDYATKSNVFIYSIGIGDTENFKLKKGTLQKVSEQTGGRAFFPQTSADLDAAFAQIEQELRSQYLVAYTPTNKTFNGAFRNVRIEIVNPELRKQKLRLLYRQGYYARSGNAPSVATTPSK